MKNLDEATRAYFYRIATAAVPLLVLYGVLAEGTAALWLGLAGAVLALGEGALATVHTSTKSSPTYHGGDIPPMT